MRSGAGDRKHILFLAPNLGIGGAQMHLIRYANGLRARNYRVSVVIVGPDDGLIEAFRKDIALFILGSRMRYPLLWWRLIHQVRQLAPDVLVGWSLYSNFAALLVSYFYRPPRLMLVELSYPPALRWFFRSFNYRLIKLMIRWLFPRADVVTANSNEALDVLRRWAPRIKESRRILNPLDFAEIDKLSLRNPMPPYVVNKNDRVLILAIGRIVLKYKGFDVLVRACVRLKDMSGWHAQIVGSGPDEFVLKKLVDDLGLSERVSIISAVTNPFPLYRAADIVVLPSRHEGFPNVLFEAMAMGKATVATDCRSGPREMTADGRHGRLVDVDDDLALARELRRLISSAEERTRLGLEAKAHVRKVYSEQKVFDELIACIDPKP
jgi:glycosyltransferase involved in cell wall biosynthesis